MERNAAVGYAAFGRETTKGVAVTPGVYVPYYSQSLFTDNHLIQDQPIYGNRFSTFQNLRGLRSHTGSITLMAEPNTSLYVHDMIAAKGTTSGGGPYTHPFGASNTQDPASYTVDLSFGSQVVRFFGLEASSLQYAWESQRMQFNLNVSALGSFYGREIASVSTDTVTLKTDYDLAPTRGLVASDLVAIKKADGTLTTSFTVASITDTTVTLNATAAAFAAGDMLVLRAATPSLSLLEPFLWGKTQFRFADTASAALSATQTRLDEGTEITLTNEFEDEEGSKRSGGFDPASLVRTRYNIEANIKKFFDQPDEIKRWNALSKRAMVMRAFSGPANEYELRVTINNMATMTNETATESGGVIYYEITYSPAYDQTDGQAFDCKVINNLATL